MFVHALLLHPCHSCRLVPSHPRHRPPKPHSCTQGGDGFGDADVAAQGLTCSASQCTLSFAGISADWITPPDLNAHSRDVDRWRAEVRAVGLGGADSKSTFGILSNK